jgi:hypothetical protein
MYNLLGVCWHILNNTMSQYYVHHYWIFGPNDLQQSFLKQDPAFKYAGEVQASLFKKWVHKVCDWIKQGQLTMKQGIMISGKYYTGKAYKFFEKHFFLL